MLGHELTEEPFVRLLGIAIFVLAFVPLIFGGTIYRMLEKVMSLKLILILGYLTFVAVFLVSPRNMWEVATGFVEFGTLRRAGRNDHRRSPFPFHAGRQRRSLVGQRDDGKRQPS